MRPAPHRQLVGVKADVTTEPQMRDAIGTRLSEHPGRRYAEQITGRRRVEQRPEGYVQLRRAACHGT